MAARLLLLTAAFLLLLSSLLPSHILPAAALGDDDEDLRFLEEAEPPDAVSGGGEHATDSDFDDGDDDDENYDDFDDPSDLGHEVGEELPDIDEKDVVVLTGGNFSDFVDENKYVLVEFYAPWCGHCQALAPEFAAAATELKVDSVKLVKVDATEESDLAEEFEVQGFPTLFFFLDGDHKPYSGQRTKDAMVTWIRKKIGPGIVNLTTTEEAERVLTSETKVALGFLDYLSGPDSDELSAASKLDDDVNFYQTNNLNVAKMFHLDSDVKRPALVLLKKEAEKVAYFDGPFKKTSIAEFISANKLPLVTIFSRESSSLIFGSTIKKQILLFASSNYSKSAFTTFQEAAKLFKGKLIFVYIKIDDEEVGKPVAEYFGVTGEDPKIMGFEGGDDTKKYFLEGDFTVDRIKSFGEAFLEDKLKPFYRSDPIPEINDGDVKVVVGNNFDDIVLDESKDVLLELYAPWCGHCQALEPTYNKLAKHLRGVDSLVIAKMDATTNEHPRARPDGFPTIVFFPAGKKTSDPIPVETDRTVVELFKFLKKHASIPFKLQRQGASASAAAKVEAESSITDSKKDEL